MITKLRIESFKSIESAEIELGNINVFIGANGSGKSNLLEALGILAAAAFGRVDAESLLRRGCRPGGFFRPMFPAYKGSSNAIIRASDGSTSYEVELASPDPRRSKPWEYKKEILTNDSLIMVDRRTNEEPSKGSPEIGLAALKWAEMGFDTPANLIPFWIDLTEYSIFAPQVPVLRDQIQDPQMRHPLGLSGGGLAKAMEELLESKEMEEQLNAEFRCSTDSVQRVHVSPPQDQASFASARFDLQFFDRFFRELDNGDPVYLGVDQVNEGALYLAFVATLCLHPEAPGLFALENADHGLNPLSARHVMTAMCQWLLAEGQSRQALLTTQNPFALDGLPLSDERVRLFTVDRDDRGTTCVRRFVVTDEHRKMASKGWTLSRMWVNGLIGGVPNV